MRFYPGFDTNSAVLMQDLFRMLGLEKMSEQEKDNYFDKFLHIVLKYLLQEKVKDSVEKERLPEIMKAYEEGSVENSEESMQRLVEVIPEFEELFTQALTEVKIRVVKDHYESLVKDLETEAAIKLGDEKSVVEKKLEEAKVNLNHVYEGRFDLINNKQ